MDLFHRHRIAPHNLLPQDGVVEYYGPVFDGFQADALLDQLMNRVAWRHDEALIYGRRIATKRQVAWYADAPFSYTYSRTTKTALKWPPFLQQLKSHVEKECGESFNSCLLNLYRDGSEGMSWHSDAEKDLVKDGAIGSLSFGAARKFVLKHKETKTTVSKELEHGSLLVMRGTTQTHWLHSVPKTKLITTPRINLTFRKVRNREN